MAAFLRVLQRVVVQVDLDHVLAGTLHRLLDRDRHLARLAVAETDLALPVTDDGQRGKAELTATLDDFRDTIDRDEFLDQVVARLCLFVSCHSFFRFLPLGPEELPISLAPEMFLKLESRFASGIGQCLDATVIAETPSDRTQPYRCLRPSLSRRYVRQRWRSRLDVAADLTPLRTSDSSVDADTSTVPPSGPITCA